MLDAIGMLEVKNLCLIKITTNKTTAATPVEECGGNFFSIP